jgi:hypothetical protein
MPQGTGQELSQIEPIQRILFGSSLVVLCKPNQKPGVDQSNARAALLIEGLMVCILGRMREIIAFHRSL